MLRRMSRKLRIAVAGASGRMGKTVLGAVEESGDCVLAGALESPKHSDIGAPHAGALTDDPERAIANADAIIDFSTPDATAHLTKLAAEKHIPHIIGTTGFSPTQDKTIREAASRTVVVKSGNMSLGVALLARLVKEAAIALPDFDVEIVEMHHRMKVDAPSGTALLLGEAAAAGRNVRLSDKSVRGRDGQTGARESGAIGFASLRGGSVVGEHRVILAGPHERIELAHVAEDRMIFARGALAAARWSIGKPAGLYSIADVVG